MLAQLRNMTVKMRGGGWRWRKISYCNIVSVLASLPIFVEMEGGGGDD